MRPAAVAAAFVFAVAVVTAAGVVATDRDVPGLPAAEVVVPAENRSIPPAGVADWSTRYDAGGVESFSAVLARPRGGHLLAGTVAESGTRTGVVVAVDRWGRVEWNRSLPFPDPALAAVGPRAVAGESGVSVTGGPAAGGDGATTTGTVGGWVAAGDGHVVRGTFDGTVRWHRDGVVNRSAPVSVAATREGVLVAGSGLVGLDHDGSVTWRRNRTMRVFDASRGFGDRTGGYYLVGCRVVDGERRPATVRLAPNGSVRDRATVGERPGCLTAVLTMPNGGHVVGGWRVNASPSAAAGGTGWTTGYVARVTVLGTVIWERAPRAGAFARVADLALGPASSAAALVRGDNGSVLAEYSPVGRGMSSRDVDGASAVGWAPGRRYVLAGRAGRDARALVLDLYDPVGRLATPQNGIVAADERTHLDASTFLYRYADAYRWDFDGDGDIDDASAQPWIDHRFRGTGRTYDLTVIAYDTTRVTAVRTVRLRTAENDRPSLRVETDRVRVGEVVTLEASVGDRVGATTVDWTLPNGSTVSGGSIRYRFASTGVVRVPVVVTDEYGARRATVAEIEVYRPGPVERVRLLVGGGDGATTLVGVAVAVGAGLGLLAVRRRKRRGQR